MKRMNLNAVIDAMAFFCFVLLTTTGVLMRYLLPPGSGHSSTIWGMDRHEWGGVHFWLSVVLFSTLSLHLVLHWQWIVNIVRGHPVPGSGLRMGLGIVGALAVVALGISPLLTPVEQDSARTESTLLSNHEDKDALVRGSMSLREVEEATGVPAAHIIEALKLPTATSPDEGLGSLKKRHQFEIKDVREIVKQYRQRQ